MEARAEAVSKNSITTFRKILQARFLVKENGRFEWRFNASLKPGSDPYLCTFLGCWSVMKGVQVGE
jgi:hypothetical protein